MRTLPVSNVPSALCANGAQWYPERTAMSYSVFKICDISDGVFLSDVMLTTPLRCAADIYP